MIRAALLLALLGVPAGAATRDDCTALVDRVEIEAGGTNVVAGICVFSDLRFVVGGSTWRADAMTLGGDIDALPDALPTRLSGGVTGLVPDPRITGRPGLEWLMRERAGAGVRVSFDMTGEAGVVRLNSLVIRMDGRNEVAVTARIAGVPELWPVDAVAASAIRVQALDVEMVFDGMFEAVALMPLGTALLDLTRDAEPQVEALREMAAMFLAGFAGTAQAENAAQVRAFAEALPQPRGTLEIGINGAGLAMIQLLPFMTGTVTPAYITRVADAAALDVFWTPDDR